MANSEVSRLKFNDTTYEIADELARESIGTALTEVASVDAKADAYNTALSGRITNLENSSGAVLVAKTRTAMTDTSKIYVYTGTTATVSGVTYTPGHWYYHNGSKWTDGGAYTQNLDAIDATLTLSNKGADAKVVGGRFSLVESDVSDLKNDLSDYGVTDNPNFNAILFGLFDPTNTDYSIVTWVRVLNGAGNLYGFRFYNSSNTIVKQITFTQYKWKDYNIVRNDNYTLYLGRVSAITATSKDFAINVRTDAIHSDLFTPQIDKKNTENKIEIRKVSENWTIRNLEAVSVSITEGKMLDDNGNIINNASYSIAEFTTATKKSFRINNLRTGGSYKYMTAVYIKNGSELLGRYIPLEDADLTLCVFNVIGTVQICYRNSLVPVVYSGEISIVNEATPEMYGAIGDGIADDTAAVSLALQNNDDVLFANLYKVTSSIIITGGSKKIHGEGGTHRSSGIFYTGDNALFIIKGHGNAVSDIALWAENYNNGAICFRHDATDGNNDLECTNCHFFNWTTVDYGGGRGHVFRGCSVSSVNTLVEVRYNYTGGEGLEGPYGNRRIKVSNCIFHVMAGNYTTNPRAGVVKIIDSVANRPAYGIEITDNYTDGTSQMLFADSEIIGLNFSNNVFIKLNAGRFIVFSYDDISYSNISNNIVLNDVIDGTGAKIQSFISAKNILYSNIKDNIIKAYMDHPFINANNGSADSSAGAIVGCTICGNKMGNTSVSPIVSQCNNCIIKDNYSNAAIEPTGNGNTIADNKVVTFA